MWCRLQNVLAVLNMGFSEGRWRWTFRLDVDLPGSECTNFGATTKPITSFSYTDPHSFMYRAFNGSLYGRGKAGVNRRPCHPGETVQFELDCEAGTISLWVNDEPQGVIFTEVTGTIYPAVAFYSSLRTVSIVKVQRVSGTGSGASAAVSAHAKALVREVQKKKEEVRAVC